MHIEGHSTRYFGHDKYKLEPKCDGDSSENVKQAIGLISKTTTLHVQHTFFVHFFASPHDYGVKIPMEDVNKRQRIFLSLSNLSVVPKKSTPGKFAFIWHFQQSGINATKFEKTRVHFKSDVFAAELSIGQCFFTYPNNIPRSLYKSSLGWVFSRRF